MSDYGTDKIFATIRSCALFAGLKNSEIDEIASISELKVLGAGQLLFSDGDPASAFYLIAEGRMRIYKLSSTGREQTLITPGPGTSIAEAALFAGGIYPAYAEASEDSELVCIDKNRFLGLIETKPQLAVNMIALLSERLKNFARKIEQLSLMGVVPRLAEYIARHSENDHEFTLKISKGELASLLGTVPETLSRAFAKLKAGGYISESGHEITVNNPDGLAEIASSYE